jgi:hypothetical protein
VKEFRCDAAEGDLKAIEEELREREKKLQLSSGVKVRVR